MSTFLKDTHKIKSMCSESIQPQEKQFIPQTTGKQSCF